MYGVLALGRESLENPKFGTSLSNTVNSRPAWATQQDPQKTKGWAGWAQGEEERKNSEHSPIKGQMQKGNAARY